MCGFAAAFGNPNAVMRAIKGMHYRGLPGHTSFHSDGYTHIAHARLPIVDLSSNGDQPARIGKRIGFLVGEVFNFKEVSNQDTDTKAILEVFLKEGLSGFHKFDGFWSFVTVHNDKLLAATDYLSQKPIYYRTDCKAIASEPAALLEFGDSDWDEVFFSNVNKWGYDPTGRTAWQDIKQLPAGHYWYDGVIKPYWDWSQVESMGVMTAIIQATMNRLLGDQPIACLLSGGLDSSIVFSLCKELGADIKSFHVDNDEAEYAKLVDPNTIALPLSGLPYAEAIKFHQSPVDLGSVYPQALLAQAVAKEGYHVCLTGDGADELFGGYSRSERYDSQMSDVFVELPYYHLPRLDRLMMRSTIELRTPFLAPKVVKAAMALPYAQRQGKQILKDLFADILHKDILNRPKKALKTESISSGSHNIQSNINLFKDIYDSSNLRIQH